MAQGPFPVHPAGTDHLHRGRQRLRQVDAAPGPSPPAEAVQGGRFCSTARASTGCRPRRWRRTWGSCRSRRSRPRASPWPTWWPGGATRTRSGSGSGRRRRADHHRRHGRHQHARAGQPGRSTSCPAGSASGSGSRWRWPRAPTSCCWTSRRPSSTSPIRWRSWTCWST